MENRPLIEQTVSENPGIGFSELKRKTGLANGVLQYHLCESKQTTRKKGAILKKGFCRDCAFQNLCQNKCLLKALRKPRNREILELKLKGTRNKDIAERLELDPSTVTHHVQKLEELGLL